MGDASHVLADVRRWACETLSASDAGRLCGMLSELSRHIFRLEDENAKLHRLVKALVAVADLVDCEECPYQYSACGIEVDE